MTDPSPSRADSSPDSEEESAGDASGAGKANSGETNEAQFRLLAENAPDVIVRLDRELRYLYVNPAVKEATGIASDQFIGRTKRELGLPEEMCEFLDRELEKSFETGKRRSGRQHHGGQGLSAKPGRFGIRGAGRGGHGPGIH